MEKIIIKKELNVDDFVVITNSVGWFYPSRDFIQKALNNTDMLFSMSENNKAVGMARVITDHATFYCIRDLAIKSNFQRKGYGTFLLNFILNEIRKDSQSCPCMVELQSVKGVEGFYKKFGFKERPNDKAGSGLYMLLNKIR